jgi:hypothetical protein
MMARYIKMVFNHKEVENVYCNVRCWDGVYYMEVPAEEEGVPLLELEPAGACNTLLGVIGWMAEHGYETEPCSIE